MGSRGRWLGAAVVGLALHPSTAAGSEVGTAPFREQEVVIEGAPAGRLAGTLTLPTNASLPFAVVVTLTGSGAHHRDGNRTPADPYRPFRQIAHALAGYGVATLRLDDRGVGGSTGNNDAASGDDVAADTHAALGWLRKRQDVAGDKLALIGHSFGGAVAPLVASTDPRLAAVVLLGAPAVTFRQTMRYQNHYRIWSDPAIRPEDREAELARATKRQAEYVRTGGVAWRRWSQDRDPLPTARLVRCPVLILAGLTDRAVDPENARTLSRTLREAGNAAVTLRLFPEVNHHFQHDPVGAREGYNRLPTQDLAPEVLQAMGEWLRGVLEPGRAANGEER
jgi:uncharacterized protein